MEKHLEDYVFRTFFEDEGNNSAVLLKGNGSRIDLRLLFNKATQKGYQSGWIENSKVELTLQEKCKRLIQYAINDA